MELQTIGCLPTHLDLILLQHQKPVTARQHTPEAPKLGLLQHPRIREDMEDNHMDIDKIA